MSVPVPTLAADGLSIGYRSRRRQTVVAAELALQLWPGELVCLLGPNGAGKSTLMRTIAGMQPPLSGRVLLNGVDIQSLKPAAIARQLSVVLTEKVDTGLLPAYGVVALGRYPYTDWQGRLTEHDQQIVAEALAAVGATGLADRPVTELSDGERQKIMIARALAQEPQLMLLDEPTAYLDLPRRVEVMQILRRLAQAERCTILLSTHDLDLALRSADQIWLLHEGKLQTGMPEELVLQGHFAATFASEGITFDVLSGSFAVEAPAGVALFVAGSGPEAVWSKRALARAGYRLVAEPANAAAQVQAGAGGWQLRVGGREHTAGSLAELLQVVRAHFPLPGPVSTRS
ncbi:MAG: ABC transporter ATP-binding protein [Anaerolineales bacterium]|nr:ABC transporter ATP-binding protein [Anaerolineales bacterium]